MAYDFSTVDGQPLEELWQGHMQEDAEIAQAALSWMRGTSRQIDPKLSDFKIGEYLQNNPDPHPAADAPYSNQAQIFDATTIPQAVRPTAQTRLQLLHDGYVLRGIWHAYLIKYLLDSHSKRDTRKNEFRDKLIGLCGEEAAGRVLSGIRADNISGLINSGQSIVHDRQNILIVLDVSRSMGGPRPFTLRGAPTRSQLKAQAGNPTGLQQACLVIKQVLAALPDNINCGLRTYGGSPDNGYGLLQQQDSKLLVSPTDKGSRQQILNLIQSLTPNGRNPVLYALREAINTDLPALPGNSAILLIGDGQIEGMPSNRGGYAKVLQLFQGPPPPVLFFKTEEQGRQIDKGRAFQALANITKGKYYDTDTLPDLLNDLKSIGKKPAAEAEKRHDN